MYLKKVIISIRMTYMILNLPYAALRTFEAVVRLNGFSAAALELGVSQSAVSQHVKSLEEWLKEELLIRGARKSKPTPYGALLAQEVSNGLTGISEVCTKIRQGRRADKTIVISCLPGFAFVWLFPRLLRFDLAHPDLSISVTTDTGLNPFSGTEADIGIRYGIEKFGELQVDHLMDEQLFPVCAPGLVQGQHALHDVASLVHHTMLQDEVLNTSSPNPTWEYWAKSCGVTLPTGIRARRFGQSNMVIQAAIEGLGVALGREPLVIEALRDGRLVRPFPETTKSPFAYWLVRRKEKQERKKIGEFLEWIKFEAQQQPTLPEFRRPNQAV